ncbi:MAG: 5-oxoprolinase subunit PxpB [Acidobacteria bacterium]|nr:5-oxoprolinase subunit PxpB [Acidobacteriota bacterium]
MTHECRLTWLGDAALSIRADERDVLAANTRVHEWAARIRAANVAAVRDVVPGMRELVVHIDPLHADVGEIERALRTDATRGATTPVAPRTIEIVVTYGGDGGPDLDDLARATGLTSDEVCRRHRETIYTVHFVGFLPGFPYLGPLDPALQVPRRTTPRPRVPPGSVAVAGEYTGIYPWPSPGGWHVIGRADVTLFDAAARPPALLSPGDRVRFVERRS